MNRDACRPLTIQLPKVVNCDKVLIVFKVRKMFREANICEGKKIKFIEF